MALASLDDLKRYLGKEDGGEDGLLDMILDGVSARMQRWIGNPVEVATYVGEPHYAAGYSTIVMDFGPVKEVTSVTEGDVSLDVTEGTADWRLENDRTLRRLSGGTPISWNGQILVTYKAGFESIPDDLVLAAVVQSAFEYRQSKPGGDRLGLGNISPESGDGVGYVTHEFLPVVVEAMTPYKSIG